MIIESIRNDPEWKGGEYQTQPQVGLRGGLNVFLIMTSSPLAWQKAAPTRDAADAFLATQMQRLLAVTDANDLIYALDASRDYDPSKALETIRAPLLAINSADDPINPPELGIMDALMPRVKRGRYVLIPTSDKTRGHGTHSLPEVWGAHLEAFLKELSVRP
jgi:homoserine O-acetyltransferase